MGKATCLTSSACVCGSCGPAYSHLDRSGVRELRSEAEADVTFKTHPQGPSSASQSLSLKESVISQNGIVSWDQALKHVSLWGTRHMQTTAHKQQGVFLTHEFRRLES